MTTNQDTQTDVPFTVNDTDLGDDSPAHVGDGAAQRRVLAGSTGYTYAGPGATSGGEA